MISLHEPSFSFTQPIVNQTPSKCTIIYKFRYENEEYLDLRDRDLIIEMDLELSNSCLKEHCNPRKVQQKVVIPITEEVVTQPVKIPIITPLSKTNPCQEELFIHVSFSGELKMQKGDVLQIGLNFAHQHCPYTEFDPLLGTREFVFHIGPHKIYDTVVVNSFDERLRIKPIDFDLKPRNRNPYLFLIPTPEELGVVAKIPPEQEKVVIIRLTNEKGPTTLNRLYFDTQPIAPRSKWKISFWYATSSTTRFSVRLNEWQNLPGRWKKMEALGLDPTLQGYGFEAVFEDQRCWKKFEQEIAISPQTSHFNLIFTIPDRHDDIDDIVVIYDLKMTPL